MNEVKQRADGTFELELPDGRVMESDSAGALINMGERLNRLAAAPGYFLDAWKAGVKLAGPRFFELDAASVDAAQDKEALRPNWDMVEAHSGAESHGERVFLYALCAFYNREWAAELSARFDESGNVGELVGILSPERIQIIVDLMKSYSGW
jgi:hypothetical protein